MTSFRHDPYSNTQPVYWGPEGVKRAEIVIVKSLIRVPSRVSMQCLFGHFQYMQRIQFEMGKQIKAIVIIIECRW